MATTSTGLSAGTAAAIITPERPMQLQGYDRGPSTGTLDPLEARAIVFDDGNTQAAIVTADLIGLEYAFEGPECASVHRIRASAAAASGVPEGNIMVACSHTHASPSVLYLSHLPDDDEYQRSLEQTLGAVVGEASRAMQPVTLGVGEGMIDINVNRRLRTPDGNTAMRPNRQGVVDKRVRVLRVDPASAPAPDGTLGGRPLPQSDPLAVLFSYVCHATTMGSDNYRFSADYPGSARRVVEGVYQANGAAGTRALFLPGCFGNIRPHLLRPDESFRGATDHELLVIGRLLGSEVVQTAERVVSEPVTAIAVARREVSLPYGALPSEAELRAAAADERRSGWANVMLAQIERDGSLPTAGHGRSTGPAARAALAGDYTGRDAAGDRAVHRARLCGLGPRATGAGRADFDTRLHQRQRGVPLHGQHDLRARLRAIHRLFRLPPPGSLCARSGGGID